MARTPFRDIQQISVATLTAYYTAPTGVNTTLSVVRAINVTATALNIDVYKNDGATDFLIDTFHLPGGSGRSRQLYGMERVVLHSGDSLKFQPDGATAWNLDINGSEVEV